MSQITTHLLTEDPSVVLIGNNSVFRTQIEKSLQDQGLQIITIDVDNLCQDNLDLEKFNNAYKIIWVYESNSDEPTHYLKILNLLKEITSPIIIISNLIPNLTNSNNNFFQNWRDKSQKQSQFIIDCTFHLPKVNFIFGQDIITSNVNNTSLEFIVKNIQSGEIFNPNIPLNFVEMDNFIKSFKKYLFRPGNNGSVLIKGEISVNNSIISLIKKLYDSYHNINLEIKSIFLEVESPVPFSIETEILSCDEKILITKIIKTLPTPKETFSKDNINLFEKPDESLKIPKTKIIMPQREKIDINNEIQRIFKSTRTEVKVNRIRKIAKSTKKITKKSKRKKFLFIGGIGMTGAAVGTIVLVLVFMVSNTIFKKEFTASLSRGINYDSIFIKENKLKNITNFMNIQVDGYKSILENNFMDQVSLMVMTSKDIQTAPQILLEVTEASKNLFLQITTGDINKTSEVAQRLDNKVRLAYEKLSSIQARLDKIDLDIDSDEKENLVKNYSNKIKEIRAEMSIQQQLQPILTSLTGETSRKTYAVIFQNNQELRPTGGFIQAVAILNFDNGVLISHRVHSVYDLDKKLPGEIKPPQDIKKYLGEEKWYLRDSNWDPDFPSTSKQIGWFLNKSLGIDVDGVIAINLITLRDILEATGPIDLSEYNEVITYKNVFERMEFHSEVVLVESPDSTDYSVTILEGLINKILGVSREKIPVLLSSFKNSLNDKQMLISVLEKSDRSVFHSLGWTGGLVKPQCPTRLSIVGCKVDAFAQVEANIGINKANYYLERSITHNIKVSRHQAIHKRKIIFENNAKSNSWPKGTYKSYQRFYIDETATLENVLINGSVLIDDQISEKKVNGFKEIGIRVDVPIQKQVVVEIEYSTPHNYLDDFSYVFFNQRQSGTFGDSVAVTFEYTDDIEPVLIAPAAEVYGKKIIFDANLESSLFSVEFK